jgi:hypothetical protein
MVFIIIIAHKNHLKWVHNAITMHMSIFSSGTEHSRVFNITILIPAEPRWKRYKVVMASEWIPYDGLCAFPIEEDGKTMVEAMNAEISISTVLLQWEARDRDLVGCIHCRHEYCKPTMIPCKEAK